jgi:hypothetical protein
MIIPNVTIGIIFMFFRVMVLVIGMKSINIKSFFADWIRLKG